MKLGVLDLIVITLITGTPAITNAAPSGFEGGAPFILRSNVQQDNAAFFDHKYVSYHHVEDGNSFLSLGRKAEATAFQIVKDTVVVRNTSPPVSIALYPYGTKVVIYDDGKSTASSPDGKILEPNGPGEFWKPILDTGSGTPCADPTRQYGLLFNNIRFSNWGACKKPVDGDADRIEVYWQKSPGRIQGPPGCATMFLNVEQASQSGY
ncbi:MAG: hypothetical protein M1830_001012 [Pleopsidium flavum]|nr:MAG: hypothetical protein M1830_001012 [Pleopsidium flavum]